MQQTHASNIRKATREDLFDLAILGKQFVREAKENGYRLTFSQEKFTSSFFNVIDNLDYLLLVYEIEGEAVGFFLGAVFEPLFSKDLLAVEMFWWVEEDYRGNRQSLGLLKTFEDWAKEKGASEVSVSDLQGVKDLDKLYKRLGYTKSEVTYKKDL